MNKTKKLNTGLVVSYGRFNYRVIHTKDMYFIFREINNTIVQGKIIVPKIIEEYEKILNINQ